MKFRADISHCENRRDKILSVCQSGPEGQVEHEVIIQRGPKEYDFFDDCPGPRISCDELGLDLEPGPEKIVFAENTMTIILSGHESVEVDLAGLTAAERRELKTVAKKLFQ